MNLCNINVESFDKIYYQENGVYYSGCYDYENKNGLVYFYNDMGEGYIGEYENNEPKGLFIKMDEN